MSSLYSWVKRNWAVLVLWAALSAAADINPAKLDACPGYYATNVKTSDGILTADLTLAGLACNVFGEDLKRLSLSVVYETSMVMCDLVLLSV